MIWSHIPSDKWIALHFKPVESNQNIDKGETA